MLAAYQQHATGRKTAVFVPTVALAHTIAGVFSDARIRAEALDANTPIEHRRGILDRLRSAQTRVVVNVGVLSKGWDEPSLQCIVVATPTRSQVKYAQIAGRGLRTYPGKTDCLIIDVVGVTDRLDLQTLPRLFGLRTHPEPGTTVTEALQRQAADDDVAATAAAAARKPPAEGAMRSRQVSVLGPRQRDRPMHRLRHERFWLLSAGQGTILALGPMRDAEGDRWAVVRLDRDRHEILARDVDLGYAHGIAEDHIRTMGAHRLAGPHATWRRKPITDAQAQTLRRLGIPIPDQATKGEASDLIALAEGARRLRALIGQRAA